MSFGIPSPAELCNVDVCAVLRPDSNKTLVLATYLSQFGCSLQELR